MKDLELLGRLGDQRAAPFVLGLCKQSLREEGVNVAYAIAEYFGTSELPLVDDSGFDESDDSADLRADAFGQDWYESRSDGDAADKLTLDTTRFSDNVAALKYSDPSGTGYAYLTQEFPSPQSDTFCVSFDMFIDEIFDNDNRDRSGMIYIGDDNNDSDGSAASLCFIGVFSN